MIAPAGPSRSARDMPDPIRVGDGDTIHMCGERVRPAAIAAPERLSGGRGQ